MSTAEERSPLHWKHVEALLDSLGVFTRAAEEQAGEHTEVTR